MVRKRTLRIGQHFEKGKEVVRKSQQMYSIYYAGDKDPCRVLAFSLGEAKLFARYASSNLVHKPVNKVVLFRGNPWRHYSISRDVIVRLMRRDGIGI